MTLLFVGCADSPGPPERSARVSSPRETEQERVPGVLEGVRLAGDSSHDHVEGPIDYSSTKYQIQKEAPPAPPLGGSHNPKWLSCDIYTTPVPNEYAVHSIERGGVWLTYRPGLPSEQIRRLAALAEISNVTREYVLVSPLEGIPAPIVAATWGLWLPAKNARDPALPVFVEAYSRHNIAGKAFAPCRTGGLTPEQAEQELTDWCARQAEPPPTCAPRRPVAP